MASSPTKKRSENGKSHTESGGSTKTRKDYITDPGWLLIQRMKANGNLPSEDRKRSERGRRLKGHTKAAGHLSAEETPTKQFSVGKRKRIRCKSETDIVLDENANVKPLSWFPGERLRSTISNGGSKRTCTESEKDYLADEKDDIEHPDWSLVERLQTNDERYQQVRDCWGSSSVPDPNRNLTCHSHRKRLLKDKRKVRQHKRQATSSLEPGKSKKRSRLCTYKFDSEIDKIKKECERKKADLQKKMVDGMSSLNQMSSRFDGYSNHSRKRKAEKLKDECEREMWEVTRSYRDKENQCENVRREVFQFCNFYKGRNATEEADPTLLTVDQSQELEDIEAVYRNFNLLYELSPEY